MMTKRERSGNHCSIIDVLCFQLDREQIRDSIVASIPACHAGDRGSIPRLGEELFALTDSEQYLLLGRHGGTFFLWRAFFKSACVEDADEIRSISKAKDKKLFLSSVESKGNADHAPKRSSVLCLDLEV
eukprot:scaffold17956_cov136-Skeletonema_dohrnii-CCMP3373.AAC.2